MYFLMNHEKVAPYEFASVSMINFIIVSESRPIFASRRSLYSLQILLILTIKVTPIFPPRAKKRTDQWFSF